MGAEAATAAMLKALFHSLFDYSKNEYLLVRGLHKEAEMLTENLDMIQKFLNDAEMGSISGEAAKSWLMRLENVGFDADNVLDEIKYHQLSNQIKAAAMANKPMIKKVLSCFSFCLHISRSRSMALRIQQINGKLESINKQATGLGLVGRLPTLPYVARETDSFTLDPIFIGRDKVASEIVEKVTACITTDERVSILAIVGMGGLGKTTLTRKVFHLLKEKNLFGSHIWVHVSQNFNPLILSKKILKGFTSNQVDIEDREDTLNRLQEYLENKTYLLILDDVWNQHIHIWDVLIFMLNS